MSTADRIGGGWYRTTSRLENEEILLEDRVHSPLRFFGWPLGKMVLTNRRLIWLPCKDGPQVFTRPVVIELGDIESIGDVKSSGLLGSQNEWYVKVGDRVHRFGFAWGLFFGAKTDRSTWLENIAAATGLGRTPIDR